MEWSDLRIFLAIAREGTLGAAARKLAQTQPTMGRRLRVLEDALGHTLFQRTKDGFVLTDEGSTLLGHAERMEAEALAIERRLAGQTQQLEGLLRITSSDWFGAHIPTPVLAEFSILHPQVTIELLTDARFLNLSRREADVAFRIRPFDEPDVVSRKLLHMRYRAYLRQGIAQTAATCKPGCALTVWVSRYCRFRWPMPPVASSRSTWAPSRQAAIHGSAITGICVDCLAFGHCSSW